MRCDLKNKTVIVTGASSGIGRAISELLISKYACTVYGVARRGELLNEIRDSLGEKFVPCAFDACEKESWSTLAGELESDGVCVDALISCAGVLPKFASVELTSSEDFERVMQINFFAQVYANEALLPIIKKSPHGAIIGFSSSSALCPFAGVSAYCASKSAIQRYYECFARENKDIYVATVMNGFVKTDIMKNQNASNRDTRLFLRACADLDRTVSKIVKKIRRGRSRIIVGADAHLMSLMYRLCPRLAPKIISSFLRKTGLEIFKDI